MGVTRAWHASLGGRVGSCDLGSGTIELTEFEMTLCAWSDYVSEQERKHDQCWREFCTAVGMLDYETPERDAS